MLKIKNETRLNGAASLPAILGAAFFWVWLDRGMFDFTLLLAPKQETIELALFLLIFSSIVSFIIVYAIVARKNKWNTWPAKTMIAVSFIGAVGGLLCLVFGERDSSLLLYLGSVLLGLSMGYQNIIWGTIAVSQSLEKTVFHISGAWGLGLILNLLIMIIPASIQSIVVMLLPLCSLAGFLGLKQLQTKDRFRIEFSDKRELAPSKNKQAFGIDIQFLLIILVFCMAFGFAYWFTPGSLLISGEQTALSLIIARCAVALAFFATFYFFSMKQLELLLRVAFSLIAAGVLLLTVGVFAPDTIGLGRILVAMGYSGFDIFVWILISYYVRTSERRSVQVIAVVMAVEQIGILLGVESSIAINHFEITAFNASIFLAAMNYVLLLSCFALMKRYDRQPILWDSAPVQSALSGDSYAAVDIFARAVRLTVREKEIAYLLAEGRNVPYISEKLYISENTVKSHVRHIYEKGNVHNRQEFLDEIEAIRHS